MKKLFKTVVLICFGFFSCGCNVAVTDTKGKTEIENVMTAGDRISAMNDFGELTIMAGKDNERYLTVSGQGTHAVWLGETVRVKLTERKERYRGSLGMYCDTNVTKIRNRGGGGEPTNIKMEEAQLHFDTLAAAEAWCSLVKFDKGFNSQAWSSDGLYIRWSYVNPEYWIFPKRTYLHVLVFQLYIGGKKISPYQVKHGTRFWYGDDNGYWDYPAILTTLEKEPIKIGGHKPSDLPGASNDKIKVEHLTDEQLKSFEEKNH